MSDVEHISVIFADIVKNLRMREEQKGELSSGRKEEQGSERAGER